MRENFSTTQIPLYKTENLDKDTIRKIKSDVIDTDWNGVSVESLTNTIEEVIVKHCEKKGAIEKNKEGKNFRSKNKISQNSKTLDEEEKSSLQGTSESKNIKRM